MVFRNPAWMKKQHDLPCDVCGKEGNTEGAHQRLDGLGGTAMKPPDNCTIPLCHEHHDMEGRGWRTFWVSTLTGATGVLKRLLLARAREVYREHFPDEGEIILLDAVQYYLVRANTPGGAKAAAAIEQFQKMYPHKRIWWRPSAG